MTGALSCGRSRNLSPLLLRWFSPEGRDVRRRLPVCRAGRRDTLSRPWRSRGSTAVLRGADGGGKAVPAVGAGLDTRDVGAARVAAGLARKGSLRGRDLTSVSGRSMRDAGVPRAGPVSAPRLCRRRACREMSSSTTTTVSAPSTVSPSLQTARALASASRRTWSSGDSSACKVSSTSAGRAVNSIPAFERISFRRGDADARATRRSAGIEPTSKRSSPTSRSSTNSTRQMSSRWRK